MCSKGKYCGYLPFRRFRNRKGSNQLKLKKNYKFIQVQKVHNKKKIEKGLGFPTCISVNEICGHYSPLISEPSILNEGDVAKMLFLKIIL